MDWYPWYFTIYEQNTMHLNPYQDGCYRRLIDHYMKTRAPLPDNDYALARIVGDSYENWKEKAAAVVREFFKPKSGNLSHKFCDEMLDEQDSRSESRSKSAKIAAKKRWKKDELNQEDECGSHASRIPVAYETHQKTGVLHATGQDNTVDNNNQHPDSSPARKSVVKKKEIIPPDKNKPDPRDDKNSPAYDPRWYTGKVIRLRRKDYEGWHGQFGGSDDHFMEYLDGRDEWYSHQSPSIQARWFMSTAKDIQKISDHREPV